METIFSFVFLSKRLLSNLGFSVLVCFWGYEEGHVESATSLEDWLNFIFLIFFLYLDL